MVKDPVYFVRIDYDKLRQMLNPPAPIRLTDDDLCDWLVDRGFYVGMKGWYADRAAVRGLHSSVIISCEPVTAAVHR